MIRVLVVEDSATSAFLLRGILDSDPRMHVITVAESGEEGIRAAAALKPDIVTMDIHMPGMDGFEATTRIMAESPCPIVIVSASVSTGQVALSFKALDAGALSVLEKPIGPSDPDFARQARILIETIATMAEVKVVGKRRLSIKTAPARMPPAAAPLRVAPALPASGRRFDLVAIGASTGGPAALATILGGLTPDFHLPILIVQHMSEGFHRGFADWLASVSPLPVQLISRDGPMLPGVVHIAGLDRHLCLSSDHRLCLKSTAPVEGFRPSASVLFSSVAEVCGYRALAIILTGMGCDGATGLLALKEAGGYVLAQDRESCVVYGMPGAAVASGAVNRILPLASMASAILDLTGMPASPVAVAGAKHPGIDQVATVTQSRGHDHR